MLKLALICGGPSPERGISLNSARSVLDHLKSENVEIIPLYVDCKKNFYLLSVGQLYSNTPADFDFKLSTTATPLSDAELKRCLREVACVFPLIHGEFGEDGELQEFLEQNEVVFIGSGSQACRRLYPKDAAFSLMRGMNIRTLPQLILNADTKKSAIQLFFQQEKIEKAILKPALGGSSIGVQVVSSVEETEERRAAYFNEKRRGPLLLEPFCSGVEFTIVVMQNRHGQPVALVPTAIHMSYENGQIFDFRKKYLPTNQAVYQTPAPFSWEVICKIRELAMQIFTVADARDFLRLDGWLLSNGEIIFTDLNPLSGLEQNSFFFKQTAEIGMSHQEALSYLLGNFAFPLSPYKEERKRSVYIIFGSSNAERQVSLLSGTNVWLKLLSSHHFLPTPFMLGMKGDVWELPYRYALHHTVDEIEENCRNAATPCPWLKEMRREIRAALGLDTSFETALPRCLDFEQFLTLAQDQNAFLFLALHGGSGENGVLQSLLDKRNIRYNGSSEQASILCMDKYQTGLAITALEDPQITALPKKKVNFAGLKNASRGDVEDLWNELSSIGSPLIVKPRADGCSTGIVLIESAADLSRYVTWVNSGTSALPPHVFSKQKGMIERPSEPEGDFLFEPYIECDELLISNHELILVTKEGWIELTIGVLESKGIYHALSPSLSIAEGAVLSVEEKFQGGTGVNITPPPEHILSKQQVELVKQLTEKISLALGIQNYARLDLFFNHLQDRVVVIEANTLPALTPSTVLYHQALSETPPLNPVDFLEQLILSAHGD